MSADVRPFPRPYYEAPELPERALSIVTMLIDTLAEVRAGEIRSIAVIAVMADEGASIATQWSLAPGDKNALMIGACDQLKHDLLAAGRE